MTGRGNVIRWLAVTLAATLAATAGVATSAGAAKRGDGEPAPEGLPGFYAVPGKLPAKAGRIVKSQRVSAPDVDGTVYRVMYTSTDLQDEIIPVTGVIAVPDEKAPNGGYPVVSWAHGTDGMADECAPSLDAESAAPAANELLGQGWLITATDYQGEGTPGLHPYIAGENAARNTIDIVRAAQSFEPADASGDYVTWGHSQGGHTAMHVLRIAHEYAPDLELKGVVAGAPPSQFNLLYNFLITSDFRHYLLMAAGGLNAAYGDEAAPLDKVLTAKGIDLLDELEAACSRELQEQLKDVEFDEVTLTDPFTVPEWQNLLTAMDPQNFTAASDAPLLIIHGGEDEQIPVLSSQLLMGQICPGIPQIERWVYPGNSHSGVIEPSLADMIGWITYRFNDNPDVFTPTGQPDVEVTTC